MSDSTPLLHPPASPLEILQSGIKAANAPVSLACSFSMEDVTIIDIAWKAGIRLGVFAIDTGRLHEETFEVAEALLERYRLKIDWYFPIHEEVERVEREKGLYSFRESLENRFECCRIRKVEPLARALKGVAGWVSGMRRDQSITRSDLKAIETDDLNNGILKINPLIDWNEQQVIDYAKKHNLSTNRLYSRGFRSIGCAPCTRAIAPEDQVRDGRWWWENPEQKECGLHRR